MMIANTRRILVLVLAAAAAAATALTGCTTDHAQNPWPPIPATSSGPPPARLPDAAEQLTTAVRQLKTTTFRMKLTLDLAPGTGTLTGVTDPSKKVGAFTATTQGHGRDNTTIEWRLVGTTIYSKTTIDGRSANAQRPWRRLDTKTAAGLIDAFDAATMAQALTKATTIHRVNDHQITGILDNAAAATAFGLRPPTRRAGSPTPAPVTVTADLDNQYRLTGYRATVTVGNNSRRTVAFTFSDFGTPVTAEPPAPNEIVGTTLG